MLGKPEDSDNQAAATAVAAAAAATAVAAAAAATPAEENADKKEWQSYCHRAPFSTFLMFLCGYSGWSFSRYIHGIGG